MSSVVDHCLNADNGLYTYFRNTVICSKNEDIFFGNVELFLLLSKLSTKNYV